MVIRLRISSPRNTKTLKVFRRQVNTNLVGNASSDIFLQRLNIVLIPLIVFRPENASAFGVKQLHGDPDAVTGKRYRTEQNSVDIKLPADFIWIAVFRAAQFSWQRDHVKLTDPCKI